MTLDRKLPDGVNHRPFNIRDLTQRQIAEIARIVKTADRINVSPPLTISRSIAGVTLGIAPQGRQVAEDVASPFSFAVITELFIPDSECDATAAATGDDKGARMMARNVIYADESDPKVGIYDWDGDEYQVWPEIGSEYMDYRGIEYTEDGPPDINETFVKIIGDPPQVMLGQRMRFARAVEKVDNDSVKVRLLYYNRKDEKFVELKCGDEPIEEVVLLWPRLKYDDHIKYLVQKDLEGGDSENNKVPKSEAPILMLSYISGLWFAMQTLRMKVKPFRNVRRVSGCPASD